MGQLADDFEKIIWLCEVLEHNNSPCISLRLRKRIANAYARAIEKALTISWKEELPSNEQINQACFRHAERGARDFVSGS
jgi:hypothetical protein